MSPDDLLNQLEPEYRAHVKEQEIIKLFEDQLQKKAKDLISEHYAQDVHRMSAEGYRALENVVCSCATRLAIDITNVFHQHTE
jgi:hypothetical protein